MTERFICVIAFLGAVACGNEQPLSQDHIAFKASQTATAGSGSYNQFNHNSDDHNDSERLGSFSNQKYANLNVNQWIYFDPAYVAVLEKRADAALQQAEAALLLSKEKAATEAEKRRALKAANDLILAETQTISLTIAHIQQRKVQAMGVIRMTQKLVYRLKRGDADIQHINALNYLVELAEADLLDMPAKDFETADFNSRGSWRLEKNPETGNYRRVRNYVEAFYGETDELSARDFVDFLRERNQDLTGNARAYLAEVIRYVDDKLQAKIDVSDDKVQEAITSLTKRQGVLKEQLDKLNVSQG